MNGLRLFVLTKKQVSHIPDRGKHHNSQGAEEAGEKQHLNQVDANVTEQAHTQILQQAVPAEIGTHNPRVVTPGGPV